MRKSKLYAALLSVVIAFGLWYYVITTVSPDSESTIYNIPVVMDGESVLNQQRGLMITSKSTNTVSLKLSGTRADLNKVNAGNITVKVDLSKIYEPGEQELYYTPTYPGDVASNAFVVEYRSPVYVTVEKRTDKYVPVEIKWTGTRSEDYLYDTENAVLDNPTINVIGPASVADPIERAIIEVDLTDRVESLSESFRYTLVDADGNPVDAEQITTNVAEVRLDMSIQRVKEVKLLAEVIYGGGATEQNTTVEVTPGTIRVSGSDAVLEELGDSITLCTINLGEIDKVSDLSPYPISLREGVTNLSGVNEATVNISFTGLSTREFVIEDIQSVNVPEGMKAEIINVKLTVKVRGPAGEIARLTAKDISVTVDFANAEVGTSTYKATIAFTDDFQNVGAVGLHTVSATIQNKGG